MSDNFRLERKFVVRNVSFKTIDTIVSLHPSLFREMYHQRFINNIYFDTIDLRNVYDNIDGLLERAKYRIRWYGNLFADLKKPTLEIKYKRGLLGKKFHFPLKPFSFNKCFNWKELNPIAIESSLPNNICTSLLNFYPSLINRYSRKYYLNDDKKFRLTIDYNMTYYKPLYPKGVSQSELANPRDVIFELKYDSAHMEEAKSITNEFPIILSKYSKYVNGVQLISVIIFF